MIIPNWPAPTWVRAAVSTKQSEKNFFEDLQLTQPPCWLHQIHGNQVANVDHYSGEKPKADAGYTQTRLQVCAVITADCLPILICDQQGAEVAAIHAGWRGLLAGVIDNTLHCFKSDPQQLLAWIGPGIGPDHFEVNAEIRHDYVTRHPDFAAGFFQNEQHWFADLYHLARINLQQCGVTAVFGGGFCTYCDSERFYSYRRDHGVTGRLTSLIWLA